MFGCLMLVALLAVSASAAPLTWTGAVDTNFEAGGDWSGPPTDDLTTDVGTFDASSPNQPQLTRVRSISGLNFLSADSTLSAGFTLNLGAVGIDSGGAGISQTGATTPLVLVASSNSAIGAGSTLQALGIIAGNPQYTMTKDGAGALWLSNANTFLDVVPQLLLWAVDKRA